MKTTLKIKIVLLITLLPALLTSCKKSGVDEDSLIYNNRRYRDVLVSYMSEPMFRNPDFVHQVTGTEADIKLYDLDEQMLYFVINKRDYDSAETLKKITISPRSAEFGFEQNGRVFLGAYTLSGTGRFLFRIPDTDIKADSTKIIFKNFGSIKYYLSVPELADYADDIVIYGGKTDLETTKDKYLANHAAFISKPGEPTLSRFCEEIVSGEKNKEKTAQILLDFVTGNIRFNDKEALSGYEVLKRANEVLLTGSADCSGMTVLYASMLEQYNIEYFLLYFPGHIAVGVSGNFKDENGLNVEIEGKKYTLAETTAKGFEIGKTKLLKNDLTDELKYYQKPGRDSILMNYIKSN